MVGNSKVVSSSQEGIHPRLEKLLQRYQTTEWRQPIRAHNVAAFEQVLPRLQSAKDYGTSLILDSGCGTGWSTLALAQANPEALVLGVDRSQDRLSRNDKMNPPANCLLLRADCEDIWRLLSQHKIAVTKHYLFYPNPYPKPGDLQKRWYAHPVVGCLLDISRSIECRSNWRQYIDDFDYVLRLHKKSTVIDELVSGIESVSPFEKKYLNSGQPCFKLTADCS